MVGYPDVLSTVQIVANISVLISVFILFHFSRKQDRRICEALETQVLNDFNEKLYGLDEILIQHPKSYRLISDKPSQEKAVAFYVLNMFAHIQDLHKRKLMDENEYLGNLKWMKRSFETGTIKNYWLDDEEFSSSYEETFVDFVNNELLPTNLKGHLVHQLSKNTKQNPLK